MIHPYHTPPFSVEAPLICNISFSSSSSFSRINLLSFTSFVVFLFAMDSNTSAHERETRDFMNVDSFSQLPFIRPSPPPKGGSSSGAIRLFGKEFGSNREHDCSFDSNHSNSNSAAPQGELHNKESGGDSVDMSSRKFECHYCCRNFPTSQALGGHQNAHKRERQQAKRAHLQSSMVHGGLSDGHVYGLVSCNSIGSASTLPIPYHSWNSSSNSFSPGSRFYEGHGSYSSSPHQPQPINGNPLAVWRIPNGHSSPATPYGSHHRQIPLFNSKVGGELKPFSSFSSRPGSKFQLGYESKGDMQDPLSLDLHL